MAKILDREGGATKAKLGRMEQEDRTPAAAKGAQEQTHQIYIVQPGDSLSKIAKTALGDASRWPEIFEANRDKIKDPNQIRPGQELVVPK